MLVEKIRQITQGLIFVTLISYTCFGNAKPALNNNAMPPVVVYASKVGSTTWQPSLTATGTLIAQQGITVKADVSGRITQLFFDSGQYVQQGSSLVQIFPDVIAAQLQANQAMLGLSEATYHRFNSLYGREAVSKADLDTAAANLKKNQAAVLQSQAELSQTLIKAPFSGYLGIRNINVGDYLTPGAAIVQLENTDVMFADFTIPEVDLNKVKIGQRATITSDAYPNQIFQGQVTALDSAIDPNTRTLTVRIAITNPNHILLPGVFVEVELWLAAPSQSILIPQVAVVYDSTGDYVYRIIQQKAVKTIIALGNSNGNQIYVTKGLQPGDVIVTAGQMKLHDGASVVIDKPTL